MDANPSYVPAARIHTSVLAAAEKRLLIRIAERLPRRINSDHLTTLAAAAMAATGAALWAGGSHPWLLALVIPALALNWFGDSLDGTLARVRHEERPRYGYYVDHVLDAIGFIWLTAGFVFGGWMSPAAGLVFLAAYYLLVIEIALATHARGTFRLSFWGMGPTELRLVLAAGAITLLTRGAVVSVFGREWLLFDLGGLLGAGGLVLTFLATAVRNGLALYQEEKR